MSLLATVTFVGVGSFIANEQMGTDINVADQMNDILQFTTKGETPKTVTQVCRIVKSVYQDPESENLFFVWDKENNKIIVVDNDYMIYNYTEDETNLDDWYYIDSSNAKIVNDEAVFDFNILIN